MHYNRGRWPFRIVSATERFVRDEPSRQPGATRRQFLATAMGAGILAPAVSHALRRAAQGVAGKTVMTTLGAVDASRLGFTLAHEHVCSVPPERAGDRSAAVRYMVNKLMAAKDAGIESIVDTTTFDVGRDVRFGQEVARKAGIHLIVSTGQHFFAPETLNARSVAAIAEVFIREIENGIDGTGIRAGAIKVAARSEVMSAAEINVFRAAARAHKATGVPIQTHTHARRRAGERQAEIFESEGVSPSRVSLGHSDDVEEAGYLIGLARRGYTLGMDHAFYGTGPDAVVPFQKRLRYIKELVENGLSERILLSTDWELGARERLNPDGLLFVTGRTIPALRQLGLSAQQITAITVENPARFFTGSSAR